MHPLPDRSIRPASSRAAHRPDRLLAITLAAGSCLGGLFADTQSPVTPAMAPDPIEGSWVGVATAPQGTTEIGFEFDRTTQGEISIRFTMPFMHTDRASLGDNLLRSGDQYLFRPLDTAFVLTDDQLTGTFGLGRLPLTLHRGAVPAAEPPPPAYPAAPAPLWSYPLGSLTWASPVVRDGTVYVGARDGKFHAVRVTDGTAAWTWTGPNRIDGRAVVADDAVYFVDGKIDLVCLNRADGTLRWRFPLHDAALAGQPAPDNSTFNRRTATPLVTHDAVYCGSSDHGLYALEPATGRKLWRHDTGAPVYSGVAAVDADRIACGCMDGSIVVLTRATGDETGRFKAGGAVVTTPLFTAGRLIVGSRDYQLYGFNLADQAVAWRYSYWFSWVESTPQLADGVIYIGASDFRRVTAFNPADGHAFWSTDVLGLCWGTPAVSPDTVYIGTAAQNIPGTVINHLGGIMALDRKTGAVKWQLRAPPAPVNSFGGYAGSLALDGHRLIGAGFDGTLTAYPVD